MSQIWSQSDNDGANIVETALLFQGLLCARQYFDEAEGPERTLRHQIDRLWLRAEWSWFTREGFASGPSFRNGRSYYGIELPLGMAFGGPLFLAHCSFCALDPRGLKDRRADYRAAIYQPCPNPL